MELETEFVNPSSKEGFDELLKQQGVCLHSVRTYYTSIYGLVSVKNLSYHKKVTVRYTLNDWKTHFETRASFMPRAKPEVESDIDQFRFTIFANPKDFFGAAPKLSFAIRYVTEDGEERWDSNGGDNYSLKGHSKALPNECNVARTWVHFL